MRVVERNGALNEIRGARGGAPVPANAAHLAADVKVIKGDELSRQGVMIG
jgi:hypothetical protein